MSRRTTAGLTALGLMVVLLLIAGLRPVPYATITPGPTVDVLGDFDDKPIIQISGRKTYSDGGQLRMVTVYQSQPEDHLNLFEAMAGWVSSDTALIPRDVLFKEGETNKAVRQQSAQQMSSSQDNAQVAALRLAGIPYRTVVQLVDVEKGGPSDGVLEVGDEILEVNGTKVTDATSVQQVIRPLPPGSKVTVELKRKGKVLTEVVRTKGEEIPLPDPSPTEARCPTGEPVPDKMVQVSRIGVSPSERYVYPFDVKVNLSENIGGPSAGMMFALTIYDLLTPGSLTGGKAIAGSGEVAPNGVVGPIGGIGQKLIGAQRDGAELFLVASENWSEAVHSDYDRDQLTLVKVHTVEDALEAINAWREDPDGKLPECGR